MTGTLIGIYGASGFGREVMPVARENFSSDKYELVFIDDNSEFDQVNGVKVMTYLSFFSSRVHKKRGFQ